MGASCVHPEFGFTIHSIDSSSYDLRYIPYLSYVRLSGYLGMQQRFINSSSKNSHSFSKGFREMVVWGTTVSKYGCLGSDNYRGHSEVYLKIFRVSDTVAMLGIQRAEASDLSKQLQ